MTELVGVDVGSDRHYPDETRLGVCTVATGWHTAPNSTLTGSTPSRDRAFRSPPLQTLR